MIRRGLQIGGALTGLFLLLVFFTVNCRADLKDSDALLDAHWKKLTEYQLTDDINNPQGICSTDTYIVCMVNTTSKAALPDTLLAFYKGGSDAEGNPVEPYSLAMKVQDMDYEHGNGMTYNSKTDEIIIAGGHPLNPDNKGCVFILDAKTLKFKRKVRVSKKWNVQAVDYDEKKDTYLIQKAKGGNFNFVEADKDFKIIKELPDMVTMGFGGSAKTFQDLCLCGDDIISILFNHEHTYNGNIQVYNKNTLSFLGEYALKFAQDTDYLEAESITELDRGKFVVVCSQPNPRRLVLYEGKLPVTYKVDTSINNGKITEAAGSVDLGDNYEVTWSADANYKVDEIIIDGESINLGKGVSSYTFTKVTEDHAIQIKCSKLPPCKITTSAEHGSIDETQYAYKGDDVVIKFKPDPHYQLGRIIVDGKTVTSGIGKDKIILKNVKGNRDVHIIFSIIPTRRISTQVVGGKISKKEALVYEGESAQFSFHPRPDYKLFAVLVDGKKVNVDTLTDEYRFDNVKADHELMVVYYWRYLPLFLLMALAALAVLVLYLRLVFKRRSFTEERKVARVVFQQEMKEIREKEV